MLVRVTAVVAALFAASVVAAKATDCAAGEFRNSNLKCKTCKSGTYSPSPVSASSNPNPYDCEVCPAGYGSNNDHTGCIKCDPGYFSDGDEPGCQKCPSGTFNNVSGAKACCTCCAGFFSDQTRTICNKCPAGRPYSYPGSNQNVDCRLRVDALNSSPPIPEPNTSCNMVASNTCPNPGGSGPIGSAITRKKRQTTCANGFDSCPRLHGVGGNDCVDTQNDPESCGGCVGADGEGAGTDCTGIQGVSVTRCVKGSCVIDSCRRGFSKSIDGNTCVFTSRTAGSSEETALHVQDSKRSSAKRTIRHKML